MNSAKRRKSDMKLLVFGEVLWDVYTNSEHLGGAPMNFAAHCKKCGGEAWIVTAIGNDAMGKRTVCEMNKLGINTEFVITAEKETGKCMVTLDSNMIPSYNLLDNVAYDYITAPDLKENNFDVLYFGTLALRNENNRKSLKQLLNENSFGDVFVDMNIRPPFYSEEAVRFACQNATIIKISDEELPVVAGLLNMAHMSDKECAEILSKDFPNLKIIIITKGEKGSFVYDCVEGKIYESQSKKVEVVSTVGAGDSFSASFLMKYMKTKDIDISLSIATSISGFVVSCKEAIPRYELSDFE